MLYEIGEAYRIMGDVNTAEKICKGLLANKIDHRSPFVKNKYIEASFALAKVCVTKNDYSSVADCLEYIFSQYVDKSDTRTFFHSLMIQIDVFEYLGDKTGAELTKQFLESAQKLKRHMHWSSRIHLKE